MPFKRLSVSLRVIQKNSSKQMGGSSRGVPPYFESLIK